jgi:hypothetical protein
VLGFKLFNHAWDVGWIVLQIAIQEGNDITASCLKTRLHGLCLTEIPLVRDDHDVITPIGSGFQEKFARPISTPVVDQHELEVARIGVKRCVKFID